VLQKSLSGQVLSKAQVSCKADACSNKSELFADLVGKLQPNSESGHHLHPSRSTHLSGTSRLVNCPLCPPIKIQPQHKRLHSLRR